MFSNAYYCLVHVHFLEIIEGSRDNLVMAICWLLIIMMFSDAHYDDVNEYFLTYQKLVFGIKDNLVVETCWLHHLRKASATK
jgi:hypothetical protein